MGQTSPSQNRNQNQYEQREMHQYHEQNQGERNSRNETGPTSGTGSSLRSRTRTSSGSVTAIGFTNDGLNRHPSVRCRISGTSAKGCGNGKWSTIPHREQSALRALLWSTEPG